MVNALFNRKGQRKEVVLKRKTKRLIFYILILFLPMVQFAVMSIYIKASSLVMAFQKYTPTNNGYEISVTLNNFKVAWETFVANKHMLVNSMILFVISTVGGLFLAVILSYYIYKKCLGNKIFLIILFLPQVIAGVVFGLLFRYMCTDIYLYAVNLFGGSAEYGLFENLDTAFLVCIIYNVWMGIPTHILMFVGGMTSIDESLVEYGQIDGVNFWSEFFHITIPMIYPTLVTFLVVGISTFFTNQMSLYTFYRDSAISNIQTNGYFIYLTSLRSDVIATQGWLSYPELTAYGLICTLITLAIIFPTRYLLNKYGPSVD